MPLLLMGPLREFCQLVMAEPAKLLDLNFLATQYHQKFRLTMDQTYLMKNFTNALPISSVIVYLFIVFVLPKLLPVPAKDAKRPILKMVMFLWNLFLSVLSLAMLLGASVPWFTYLKNDYAWDLPGLICEEKHVLGPEEGLPHIVWAYIFALSKYLELFDTVLLVIKHPDRKVPFLHWFHHLTVLLFTWYAVYTQYAVGYCFIIMNSLIHTFMYYYYALTELGYRPSWNFLLTIGQITQMILGIVFNSIFAYKFFKNRDAGVPAEKNCRCDAPYEIMLSCVAMYGAYLYLFVDFFVRKYFGAPAATSGKKKNE
ncbi:hypothetical protein FDP41_003633 [Naegleria fowleri]|uniref:Elongation of fatty acids protein n=1 Tax=Naegleria fowleri TaxID=5763 RepID=A0A6A5BTF1_NAEFO|nr:uncharacterized protein FDP41_003633 [Naegleria fowleri]KAF0977641.1 hypothetical protein FDP41_003633 [Naegleria fowleri]